MHIALVGQLAALILALALDLFFGDPPNRWHPVAWMGRYIAACTRPAPAGRPLMRFLYGAALVLIGGVIWTAPVVLLVRGSARVGWLFAIPVNALLLKSCFTFRGLLRAADEVRAALLDGDLHNARRLVSWHLVSRDTTTLDRELLGAATVESVAENVTDSLVAPLFFFLLFGVPGAWAYRFFNTCDSMLGYHDPEREYLGKFAARWDDLLNWLPARLTGLLMVAATWLAREDAANAWRTMWQQHARTSSPNAGWTMSAMAGALRLSLEKVGYYRLEGGQELATPQAIARASRVASLTAGLFTLLLVAGLVLKERLFHA